VFVTVVAVRILCSCTMHILQAGVKHIILAVSYRAEMLENELKVEEQRVCVYCVFCLLFC